MLRRFVGDEAFFKGVRRYYGDNRFKKAGTADLQKAMQAESGLDLTRFFDRWIFDSGIPHLRYSTVEGPDDVTVRIEQAGELYDVPVTVSIQYRDGTVSEEVVRVTEEVTEARISVKGAIRSVELNRDHAALAHLDRSR
jgi:aminopeptidase N